MGFLPDIDDGKLKSQADVPKLYTPPKTYGLKKEEENLFDLNNLGHSVVAEDFSDSPHLNK
jgi:hypothetical protein